MNNSLEIYKKIYKELSVKFYDKKNNTIIHFINNSMMKKIQIFYSSSILLKIGVQAKIKLGGKLINALWEMLQIKENVENNEYFLLGLFKKNKNIDRIYLIQSCLKKQLELNHIGCIIS